MIEPWLHPIIRAREHLILGQVPRQSRVPKGQRGVVAIAAGSRHSLALTREGALVAWGDDSLGQTLPPWSGVGFSGRAIPSCVRRGTRRAPG
ncbi:RCC1-like domain-containing protein [Cystobacter fuscus]|uniref:RCC1-like domain-containing protein n=1 Tax=Cystobacter fuscus TaxID=43 RepID=UPI002B2AB5AE|nr:hypothetical protein F0U63_33865 [Cystobacter fuscus]